VYFLISSDIPAADSMSDIELGRAEDEPLLIIPDNIAEKTMVRSSITSSTTADNHHNRDYFQDCEKFPEYCGKFMGGFFITFFGLMSMLICYKLYEWVASISFHTSTTVEIDLGYVYVIGVMFGKLCLFLLAAGIIRMIMSHFLCSIHLRTL
jgi:hypothetical protein